MKPIKNIMLPLLSLMLLVSTMGVTMHKHYCMGRVQDVAYFQEAHSCAEKAGLGETESCPADCCDDTKESFKVDHLIKTSSDLNIELPSPEATIELPIFFFAPSLETELLSNLHYKPPLLTEFIPTRDQCFRL